MERVPFPPVGYESGNNGTPILGGTIAINEFLHTLRVTVNNSSSPTFSTMLINAYTLVDAAMSTMRTATVDDAKTIINQDVELISKYVRAYCTQRGVSPSIVVYLPDYTTIDDHLRPLSPRRQVCADTYQKLKDSVTIPDNQISIGEYAVVKCGKKTLPHLVVPKIIKTHVSFACVGIMTHIPLDLHMRDVIGRSSLYLAERYTGKIIPATDFSKKIDKSGGVPFFKETHMTLGDTTIQPLVSGKAKSALIATAVADNWCQRTSTDVAGRLSAMLTSDQRSALVKRMSVI